MSVACWICSQPYWAAGILHLARIKPTAPCEHRKLELMPRSRLAGIDAHAESKDGLVGQRA